MKKKMQKRFIRFSMLVMCSVIAILAVLAYLDHMEHLFRPRMLFGLGIVLVLVYAASTVFAGLAVKPIEEAWQKQLDFTADASHELRTPLAVFRSNLEILSEQAEETVGSQEKWIRNLQTETERMEHLVEELLILSRADTGQQQIETMEVPVDLVIRERIESVEAQAAKLGIEIREDLEEELLIRGEVSSLSKVFSVLLDNSLKYMGRAGIITVWGRHTRDGVEIIYSDNGGGIPKEHRERIFERFYRVDKNRSRTAGGSGLGLAIAKTLTEQNGGTIELDPKTEEGVKFYLRFRN